MTFKSCANCGVDVGPHNVERIQINEMGLWWHHTACGGGGFLPIKVVRERAEIKAGQSDSEVNYYQERLKEL